MEFVKNTYIGQTISGEKKVLFNAGYEASLEYAEPRKHKTPKIQLLFSPFGLPFVPIEILGTNTNKIIKDLQWTKDRTNPGGMLQLTLTPDSKTIQDIVDIINKFSFNSYSKIWGELGVDLEDLFKPMTLCQLWLDGYHIMTGTVRGCQRASTVSNDQANISYSIIIEELGNIYNMGTTSLDYILSDKLQKQESDSMKRALSLFANLKGTTIAKGIKTIITAFKLTNLENNFSYSDGFPLAYRLISEANPLGGIANLALANFMTVDSAMYELNSANGSQSVWSFIQSFIPNPWMELYTESGGRTIVTDGLSSPSAMLPGFNYVVARTTPYTNPMIGTVNPVYLSQTLVFDLTVIQMLIGGDFVIITDEMISEKSLGFDSVNQSTVFKTGYANKVPGIVDVRDEGIKSVGPFNPFASGGVPTFGIREMFQTIDATSIIGLGTAAATAERTAKNLFGLSGSFLSKNHLSNLLATWFRNQSRFREGTVTVNNIPYARPGMYCLYLPQMNGKKVENLRDIGIYYIDSLNHNYSLENNDVTLNTTLNLIRGVPLPTSVAQTALLLFDFEILPPISGLEDGEYTVLKNSRFALQSAFKG